jgi:chorismate mutase/prephenate dehydratase
VFCRCETLVSRYPEQQDARCNVLSKQANKDVSPIDLSAIRKRIDEVDAQIQALISERATFAQQVGISKGEHASAVDYYRPEREAEVLRAVLDRNKGPLRNEEMLRLFREIMSACLAQQEPLKVGYLGPEGTFTQTAVFKHFGHSVRGLPFSTIDEVFQEVESGAADFGVVPIENSTEGTVNHTLDMFLTSPLKIGGEIEMRIEQHLLGNVDGLKSIERICAHEQSLAQCRGWLREYLPHVELIGVSSNATGARRARDEAGTAAIGGDAAAEVYGVKVMVNNIEDRDDNSTRFLVIGRDLLSSSGQDKTTVLVSTSGTGGAGVLHNLLQPFSEHGISMTRIESRPSRRQNWDYVFFIDLDGHAEESPVKDALETLEKNSSLFRLIGAYPKAVR